MSQRRADEPPILLQTTYKCLTVLGGPCNALLASTGSYKWIAGTISSWTGRAYLPTYLYYPCEKDINKSIMKRKKAQKSEQQQTHERKGINCKHYYPTQLSTPRVPTNLLKTRLPLLEYYYYHKPIVQLCGSMGIAENVIPYLQSKGRQQSKDLAPPPPFTARGH